MGFGTTDKFERRICPGFKQVQGTLKPLPEYKHETQGSKLNSMLLWATAQNNGHARTQEREILKGAVQ